MDSANQSGKGEIIAYLSTPMIKSTFTKGIVYNRRQLTSLLDRIYFEEEIRNSVS
jgi:hypothetical protein